MIPAHSYLKTYSSELQLSEIEAIRHEKFKELQLPKLKPYVDALNGIEFFQTQHFNFSDAVVEIGHSDELSSTQKEHYLKALQTFVPWKKGPFRLFGTDIDSEWRSDMKWERISNEAGSLEGKKIADIGCHNGYFMFRMAAENPDLVVGFEPYGKHLLNYQLMQGFANIPSLAFELLGVEHIHLYPGFFDKIFCLGILYHHTDPVGLLRKIKSSLNKGGELYIDCQGIEGDDPVALVPSGRYACARGIWFLPTLPALINWVKRAGFSHAECFYGAPLGTDEQRETSWAPVKSLKDFLDPADPTRTVEGYPAPWRFYVKAIR